MSRSSTTSDRYFRKAVGLTHAELHTPTDISPLTIGGLVHHMAFVEDHWFVFVLLGEEYPEPWALAPWNEQPDWEFDIAADRSPTQLIGQHEASIARSRAALGQCADLDVIASRQSWNQDTSLRWILVHMIEEYARHCGHADLIREAIDGTTGD